MNRDLVKSDIGRQFIVIDTTCNHGFDIDEVVIFKGGVDMDLFEALESREYWYLDKDDVDQIQTMSIEDLGCNVSVADAYGATINTSKDGVVSYSYQEYEIDYIDGDYIIRLIDAPFTDCDSLETALYQIKNRADYA